MAVYLVQHGLSLPKEKDPERGLSPDGVEESRRIAEVARGYKVAVSAICHSGKKRALETAEIFEQALVPKGGIRKIEGLSPMDDVTEFAKTLKNDQNLMFVGHLPFMERLAAHLVAGRLEPPVFKFQNSGIVCLDREPDSGDWHIKWTLMPRIG